MRRANLIVAVTQSILLFGIPLRGAEALARGCTTADADAAIELMSQRAESWAEIYSRFERYGHCDDGAIGEQFSDSIVFTLANRWHLVPSLVKLADSNKAFGLFVVQHIDATTAPDDMTAILRNIAGGCPGNASVLCENIKQAAAETVRQFQRDGLLPSDPAPGDPKRR